MEKDISERIVVSETLKQKNKTIIEGFVKNEESITENLFLRLKSSLSKTKENFSSKFINLFLEKKISSDLLEKIENLLLVSDVGLNTARKIISNLTKAANEKQINDSEKVYRLLEYEMGKILEKSSKPLCTEGKQPFIILVVGVNGSGKTTTIGKLAHRFNQEGKSVILAAGDTFRAAASEQLQYWGYCNKIPVISKRATNTDSASVIFDAIQAAKQHNMDILIADTAGRLQNKIHLMEELKKIIRVIKKNDPNAPHEVMLIIDASIGQNSINQVGSFHESIEISGITLTKLDGTSKGGIIFSIADQFDIPIRYICIGEHIEDLYPFNVKTFVKALFT